MQDTGTRSTRERWEDYHPTKTQTFWIAVGAVGATLLIGFGTDSWVTSASAQEMTAEATSEARNQLAAAVCVEDFMGAANSGERLQQIKKASWYERDALVTEWATMPDETQPSSAVASMCATKLVELKAPKAAAAAAKPAALSSANAQ